MRTKEKIFATVVIVLFALVLAAPFAAMAIFGDTDASAEGGLEEKRELTSFPSDLTDDWCSRFETFFTDHAPLRNRLIAVEMHVSQRYETFYRTRINPRLTTLLVRPQGEPTLPPGATPTPEATIDPSIFQGLFGTATPAPTTEPTATVPEATTAMPSASTPGVPGETGSGPDATPHAHVWDGGTVTRHADCRQEGEQRFTCTVCGEIRTETIPRMDHTYEVIRSQQASRTQYGYTLERCTLCGTRNLRDLVNKQIDSSYFALQVNPSGAVIYGRTWSNWLFYNGDASLDFYMGSNPLSNAQMASWRATFETLQALCDARGIRLVVMAAPNKEQIYPEYMPTVNVTANDRKREAVFTRYMQENSTVPYLYPFAELNTAKILYDVFWAQDTHWNAVGGFVGAMSLYSALGMETTGILDLDVRESTRTGGDLSNFCGFQTTYTDYVTVDARQNLTYKPEIHVREQIMSASNVIRQYTSDSANSAKIVVLGDSFRESMQPYLARDFAKATVAHRGDFGHGVVQSALRELSEGDVLLLLAVERYDSQNVDMANQLISFFRTN